MKLHKSKYSIPDAEVFIANVRLFFADLITKYGYKEDIGTGEFSTEIIFKNKKIKRRIEIKNEIHPYDYGFSIFIYNTANEEYNIIVNIPWDKEDKDCKFVERSSKFFFSDMPHLIDGTEWKSYGKILQQE